MRKGLTMRNALRRTHLKSILALSNTPCVRRKAHYCQEPLMPYRLRRALFLSNPYFIEKTEHHERHAKMKDEHVPKLIIDRSNKKIRRPERQQRREGSSRSSPPRAYSKEENEHREPN